MKQVVYFALSGILIFSFHYLYDRVAGFPPASGLAADVYHFQYVRENVSKLFSFHGVYDIFSNFGLWILAPIGAWWLTNDYRATVRQHAVWYMAFFMLSVLIHMLLSGYFERMFYLSMPLICMFTALSIQALRKHYILTKK